MIDSFSVTYFIFILFIFFLQCWKIASRQEPKVSNLPLAKCTKSYFQIRIPNFRYANNANLSNRDSTTNKKINPGTKKKNILFVVITLSTGDTRVFSDLRSKLNNWPHSLFILARKSLPAGEATMSMTGLTVPRLKNFPFWTSHMWINLSFDPVNKI